MIVVYIMLGISIVVGVLGCVIAVMSFKRKSGGNGVSVEQLRYENERLKNDIDVSVKLGNSALVGTLNAQNENNKHLGERVDNLTIVTDKKIDQMRNDTYRTLNELKDSLVASLNEMRGSISQSINELKAVNAQSLKEVRDDNAKNLENIKRDNAEQLEKMRETVDEKLSSTLEKRFEQSFKIVNDRLEEINRTFGELQGLQSGISDLNKIFKNVKTRGVWGEVSLENLLSQILTTEQYDKQVRVKRGSEDTVDFVIRMPGKGDGEVLLPLDAKFPVEDYTRLVEASEKGDVLGIDEASKALASRVKAEAKSIHDKYINPPKTTDFAVLYLATEGLYAEVIRREGLVEEIQNKYRVVVCGPTTIAALLNSLQMGFKSVAVEKRSAEISKLLQGFMADFDKFALYLAKTGDNIDKVKSSLENAEKRTEMIRTKLSKIQAPTDDTPIVAVQNDDEEFLLSGSEE